MQDLRHKTGGDQLIYIGKYVKPTKVNQYFARKSAQVCWVLGWPLHVPVWAQLVWENATYAAEVLTNFLGAPLGLHCCIWGCVAPDLSKYPCWSLSTTKSPFNGHVSRWPRKRCDLIKPSCCYIVRITKCMCITYSTWKIDGTRTHWRKEASQWRQCGVLLANFGSWQTLTCTTFQNIVANQVHCFMTTVFSKSSWLF